MKAIANDILRLILPNLIIALFSGGVIWFHYNRKLAREKFQYDKQLLMLKTCQSLVSKWFDKKLKGMEIVYQISKQLDEEARNIRKSVEGMNSENRWDLKELQFVCNSFQRMVVSFKETIRNQRIYIKSLIPFGDSNIYSALHNSICMRLYSMILAFQREGKEEFEKHTRCLLEKLSEAEIIYQNLHKVFEKYLGKYTETDLRGET